LIETRVHRFREPSKPTQISLKDFVTTQTSLSTSFRSQQDNVLWLQLVALQSKCRVHQRQQQQSHRPPAAPSATSASTLTTTVRRSARIIEAPQPTVRCNAAPPLRCATLRAHDSNGQWISGRITPGGCVRLPQHSTRVIVWQRHAPTTTTTCWFIHI
jgi:hypothetical protein